MDILEFYGLKEDPFRLTPDPAYFYPSANHNEALLSMNYVVEQREGFCVIIGEPGTGKTTLLNVFKENWKDKAEIALILTPRLSPEEFLLSVLDDLKVENKALNKNDILKAFRDFLIEKSQMSRPVIIIVDEAQNLPDETLEELRLLSNLETEKYKLLQIILIGQPELGKRLQTDTLRQLDQRITVRINLRPLSCAETVDYINYRLIKAGKGVLKLGYKPLLPIYKFSGGIPRVINMAVSRAIMAAYLEGGDTITSKHVRYAIRHLKMPDFPKVQAFPGSRLVYLMLLLVLIISGGAGYYYYYFIVHQRSLTANSAGRGSAAVRAAKDTVRENAPEPPVNTADAVKNEAHQKQRDAVVVAAALNIRLEPDWRAEKLGVLYEGDKVALIDEASGAKGSKWYKVAVSGGREGWIAERGVRLLVP